MTDASRPLFVVDDRCYFMQSPDEEDIRGSEILFLREWEDLPTRDALESTFRQVFDGAVSEEDDILEADLTLQVDGAPVASIHLCLTEDGLEMNGFAIEDHELEAEEDLLARLGLSEHPAGS